jgi:hypothetical protein
LYAKTKRYKEAKQMKKLTVLLAIITSLNIIACSNDDGSKADLKWKNEANQTVKDIKWKNGSKIDQIWDGVYDDNDNKETTFKGINELTGQGECLDAGGDTADISINTSTSQGIDPSSSSSTARIQENAAATLVIQSIAKK